MRKARAPDDVSRGGTLTTQVGLNATGRRLDRLAFVAVGVLVLAITWNGLRLGQNAFADLILLLATIVVLAQAFVNRRPVPLPPWLLAFAAAIVISALVEAVFPPSPAIQSRTLLQFDQVAAVGGLPINVLIPARSNVAALIKWELALVFIPILIGMVARTPWRVNRLLDLWTVSAAISAFVGILELGGFTPPLVLTHPPQAGLLGSALPAATAAAGAVHRTAGLTIQPNYLALTCVLAIPTALRWVGRSNRATAAGILTTVILLGGEYATGSRDGIISAAIALVLAIVLLPRLRPYVSLVLPVLAVAGGAVLLTTHVGHSILQQLRLTGNSQSTNGSNYQRSVARHVAYAQISSRPVAGVGFSVDNDAQNIYLQMLAAGGAITMCGFIVFVGGLADCVRRAWRGPLHEEALAIGICGFAYLVNGYYDAQIADKYLYVLPGLLFACARTTSALRSSAMAGRTKAAAPPGPRDEAFTPVGAGASPVLS